MPEDPQATPPDAPGPQRQDTDTAPPDRGAAELDLLSDAPTIAEAPEKETASRGADTVPDNDAAVRVNLDAIDSLPDPGDRYAPGPALGRGGMSVVETAIDRYMCRSTAKKIVDPESSERIMVEALVTEAQVTGQLDHPNIVPVYDLGVEADGRIFFTMRIVEGAPLSEIIASLPPGPLSRSQLLDLLEVVVKVCDALSFAHSRRIIHRDVKPANVMVGRFGQVYLMDWGLAKPIRPAPAANRFAIAGTPSFMAPEQARGEALDERTDIFALGALLYVIIGRTAPYEGLSASACLSKAKHYELPPLAQVAADSQVPGELARIISKAMALSPDDRYRTAEDLRHDLVRFIRGGGEFERRDYAEGEHIIREGEHGDEAYIVQSGSAEVYRIVKGERKSLRILQPGDLFGETAVLSAAPRVANVVARQATTVSVLTQEALEDQLSAMTPWMRSLVHTIAERFRESEEEREPTRKR